MPGSPGLLREVYLPVPAILCLQVTPPLLPVADMPQSRQGAGTDPLIAAAQQADNGTPPDFLNGPLSEEKAAPDAVLNVKATAGDGNVNMRVLIELAAVSMQGAEEACNRYLDGQQFICVLSGSSGIFMPSASIHLSTACA